MQPVEILRVQSLYKLQMGTRKRPKEVGLSLVRDERVDDNMEEMKEYLENGNWKLYEPGQACVRQLLKALYWIPEEDKKERNGYSFGQLISCLEEFTFEIPTV